MGKKKPVINEKLSFINENTFSFVLENAFKNKIKKTELTNKPLIGWIVANKHPDIKRLIGQFCSFLFFQDKKPSLVK